MAITIKKLLPAPHNAPDMGIFARDETKDFFIGAGQEVEIYHVKHDGIGTIGSIPTGFDVVHGGYLQSSEPASLPEDDAVETATIEVKRNSPTASDADISTLPEVAYSYFAVIFGFKNPGKL